MSIQRWRSAPGFGLRDQSDTPSGAVNVKRLSMTKSSRNFHSGEGRMETIGSTSAPKPTMLSTPRELAGLALALAAALAFALANASASLAYRGGSNTLTVAAIRFLLPTAALIVWMRMRGVPLSLPAHDGWVAAGLGAVTAIYSWALLSAIGTIPLALAVLVFYLFPLIATVIIAVCGWERLGWRMSSAIVLAFAGLALALHPHSGNLDLEGVALALVGALGLGIVIAVSSRVFRAGDPRPVTLYIAAVAAVVLILICAIQGEFALPRTGAGWLGFAGTSLSYAFAMIAFFIAISMIGPVRVSLLSYAEPVVAAGLGVAMLGETLTPLQITGIALVIMALLGATWRQPRPP
jgi:drug/metabolite transporter (DMT)-like permease